MLAGVKVQAAITITDQDDAAREGFPLCRTDVSNSLTINTDASVPVAALILERASVLEASNRNLEMLFASLLTVAMKSTAAGMKATAALNHRRGKVR
jgi:hypothetical protein